MFKDELVRIDTVGIASNRLGLECPFFSHMLRYIKKVPTLDVPTMGVTYNKATDDFVLGWNPEFVSRHTQAEIMAVLIHEIYHLIFRHVTTRRRTPHFVWNIGTDLAINSLIVGHHEISGRNTYDFSVKLPESGLVPGRSTQPDFAEMDEKTIEFVKKLDELIKSFPQEKSSDWYFSRLIDFYEKEGRGTCPTCGSFGKKGEAGGRDDEDADGSSGGSGGTSEDDGECRCPDCGARVQIMPESIDSHDGWDSVDDSVRARVENKVKGLVERATAAANSSSNGWGNVPAHIKKEIEASIGKYVDWRSLLKQWVGYTQPFDMTNSIKRINKKYPYIHAGKRRSRAANLMIWIDQSGSVDDESLAKAFGALNGLAKNVSFTVGFFDHSCDLGSIFTWRKGQKIPPKRTRCGGTNFDAPTAWMNDPRNSGRFDGMLIITDGECCMPNACRKKRGWIIVPNRQLNFDTNEAVFVMNDNPCAKGAWR